MRRARGERGQILAVVVLALVALLGIAAFAIDVGYAYYAKRQLQSAADAAALAGAQDLPVSSDAIKTATQYAGDNTPANLSTLTFTYQTKCTTTAVLKSACNAAVNPNALVVTGTGTTDTWFAKVFGIDHFNVSAHANACSPCSASPVDIVVAIDRTGSMCQPTGPAGDMHRPRQRQGRRAHDARDVQSALDADRHGRVPAARVDEHRPLRQALHAAATGYTGYDSAGSRLRDRHDRRRLQARRTASRPGHRACTCTPSPVPRRRASSPPATRPTARRCARPRPSCVAHGRPDVPDYIVFLTDGEANIGSVYGVGHRPTRRATRTTAAVPDGDQRRQRLQEGRHDDLQHRLRARNGELHGRQMGQAEPGVTTPRPIRSTSTTSAAPRPTPAARTTRTASPRAPRSRRTTRSRRSPRPATSTTRRTPAT